jgi:DNA modification methylase
MGSGSTIVGCINTNRKYIGVEKDGEIYKVALGRTAKVVGALESKLGLGLEAGVEAGVIPETA